MDSGSGSDIEASVCSEELELRGAAPAVAASSEDLVLPWQGDPFWELAWEQVRATVVRKLGDGSCGQASLSQSHFLVITSSSSV